MEQYYNYAKFNFYKKNASSVCNVLRKSLLFSPINDLFGL